MLDAHRLLAAYETARAELLAARKGAPHWTGELSSSALSTATAISALELVRRGSRTRQRSGAQDAIPTLPRSGERGYGECADPLPLIERGLRWLVAAQNDDGGWGDTDRSLSNIATTMLARAAIEIAGRRTQHPALWARSEEYLAARGGIAGLRKRYGRDKTFAVPILANCALAGLVDWREVAALPFELACVPQSWYRFFRLPVVSYAIPALVAIGQARFVHRPPRSPLTRFVRRAAVERSLRVLLRMQPDSGGYLEATPLTSFVVMSLAGIGRGDHPVARRGVEFLLASARPDGSWPIDTNLAAWNTTLSMNALAAGGEDVAALGCTDWLLSCQHCVRHPFTGADAGGWGWSDLSGAVPDADDTAGALLALGKVIAGPAPARSRIRRSLRAVDLASTPPRSGERGYVDNERILDAAAAGIAWLLGLQNRDGGWPTFCRGWGKLPFDRSSTDISAHALRALHAWRQTLPRGMQTEIDRANLRGLRYLARSQRSDGSWAPLWFGNQHHPEEENPVYGTAKVLLAYRDLGMPNDPAAERGMAWLLVNQRADGGWGAAGLPAQAANRLPSSVEETALAVEAVLSANSPAAAAAAERGLLWLVEKVEKKGYLDCSPIGFYFAKLWYYEKLYPLIFTVSALGTAVSQISGAAPRSCL